MASLLALAQSDGRVCPLPPQWNSLWELPGRVRLRHGWEPALPLILAAWYETSVAEKRMRLREHIEYADAHDALDTVDTFLRGLKTDEWLVLEEV
jgi:hypothetical protein